MPVAQGNAILFNSLEIDAFEREILDNPAAGEHDVSRFFSQFPKFLQLGAGAEIRREVVLAGVRQRVDFFRRNCGARYWDIVELKGPHEKLLTQARTLHPRLSGITESAISQAQDYRDLIDEDVRIREYLKLRGIEVFRPQMLIVVGQEPPDVDQHLVRHLFDRVRRRDAIEILSYTGILRFAKEHFVKTSSQILPSFQFAHPNAPAESTYQILMPVWRTGSRTSRGTTALAIECVCEDSSQPLRVTLNSEKHDSLVFDLTPPGKLEHADPAASVYIEPANGNHWNLFAERAGTRVRGLLRALPQGPHGWWHELHGIPLGGRGGTGIRIGVIDEALGHQPSDSPIAHIHNLGFGGAGVREDVAHRAYSPLSIHSYAACSLLAARRSDFPHHVGVAQGAELFFCAAGADSSTALSAARVANALDFLVEQHKCDIVVIGAGEVVSEIPSIRIATEYASELGSLCFFAAGNSGGEPRFPACYSECIAVGAIGQHGVAPDNSWEAHEERHSTQFSNASHFLWRSSARGRLVQFLGAGVSLFTTDPHGVTRSINGTSMATHIVAGTAAVVLGRDKTFRTMPRNAERYDYALRVLQEHCWNPFPSAAQFGILLA